MRHGFCLRWSQPQCLLPKLTTLFGNAGAAFCTPLLLCCLLRAKPQCSSQGKQCHTCPGGLACQGFKRRVSGSAGSWCCLCCLRLLEGWERGGSMLWLVCHPSRRWPKDVTLHCSPVFLLLSFIFITPFSSFFTEQPVLIARTVDHPKYIT